MLITCCTGTLGGTRSRLLGIGSESTGRERFLLLGTFATVGEASTVFAEVIPATCTAGCATGFGPFFFGFDELDAVQLPDCSSEPLLILCNDSRGVLVAGHFL